VAQTGSSSPHGDGCGPGTIAGDVRVFFALLSGDWSCAATLADARQEKRKQKHERRASAKVQRSSSPRQEGEEDPDIAGIVPGPQPSPWGDDETGLSHLTTIEHASWTDNPLG